MNKDKKPKADQKILISFSIKTEEKVVAPKQQDLIGEEQEEREGDEVQMQEEEVKGDDLEIHNVEKDAAKKRTCEISAKAKVRKLKECIAIELGLVEDDANNIKLYING